MHTPPHEAVPQWLRPLSEYINQPNQRFLCHPADGSSTAQWVAHVTSTLGAPASAADMALLHEQLGENAPQAFIDFYTHYNGAELYADTVEHNAIGIHAVGIRVFAIAMWERMGDYFQDWIDGEVFDAGELNARVPPWAHEAVMFGEVPNSGNYFLLALGGAQHGGIYYFDQDGLSFSLYAASLPEFFQRITSDPVQALNDLGGYARYGDDATGTQWMPQAYAAGDAVF